MLLSMRDVGVIGEEIVSPEITRLPKLQAQLG